MSESEHETEKNEEPYVIELHELRVFRLVVSAQDRKKALNKAKMQVVNQAVSAVSVSHECRYLEPLSLSPEAGLEEPKEA